MARVRVFLGGKEIPDSELKNLTIKSRTVDRIVNDVADRYNKALREIYTVDEFIKKTEDYKKNSKPSKDTKCMELKIGSRYATMYDYGEHLIRMLKRAKPYTEFIKSFCFRVEHLTGIQLYKPEKRFMTVEEFDRAFYKLLYNDGGMTYTKLIEHPDIKDEKNLIHLIETKAALSFEIKNW